VWMIEADHPEANRRRWGSHQPSIR
jgi:hypothetical protein